MADDQQTKRRNGFVLQSQEVCCEEHKRAYAAIKAQIGGIPFRFFRSDDQHVFQARLKRGRIKTIRHKSPWLVVAKVIEHISD